MDVRFSAEQEALREAAAQMVDRLGPRTVRDLDDAERTAKLESAVDGSGWRELRVATEGRSPLASGVEAAVVAEEMGRGLADVSFLGPTLAADLRRLAGAPPADVPETVAMVADLSAPAAGAGVVDAGRAVAVDARYASTVLYLVAAPGGYTLAQGVAPSDPGGADLTRPSGVLEDGPLTPVTGATVVLSDDDVTAWTALGLALTTADLVGVMRGVLTLSADYASSRRQYGVAVGSFQAVQHMLADALVAMEGSRSVSRHAAWAVDALPPAEALGAASVAKAYSARAARAVCETGIQVHGGIGNTWDCLAHVYLRRALTSIEILGGVGPSLARVLAHRGIGDDHGLR